MSEHFKSVTLVEVKDGEIVIHAERMDGKGIDSIILYMPYEQMQMDYCPCHRKTDQAT